MTLRVRNSLAFKVYQDHLAYSDTVTGLPNRRIFLRRVTKAIARSKVDRTTFALLDLGIDRFKQINHTLGHQTGDEVLRVVAERLNGSLRGSDLVARAVDGSEKMLARARGDEFIVFLPDLVSSHTGELVARRLLKSMSLPLAVGGRELFVTVSAGIALFPGDGSCRSLMDSAESAMRQAKHQRRTAASLAETEQSP